MAKQNIIKSGDVIRLLDIKNEDQRYIIVNVVDIDNVLAVDMIGRLVRFNLNQVSYVLLKQGLETIYSLVDSHLTHISLKEKNAYYKNQNLGSEIEDKFAVHKSILKHLLTINTQSNQLNIFHCNELGFELYQVGDKYVFNKFNIYTQEQVEQSISQGKFEAALAINIGEEYTSALEKLIDLYVIIKVDEHHYAYSKFWTN